MRAIPIRTRTDLALCVFKYLHNSLSFQDINVRILKKFFAIAEESGVSG